MHIHLLVPVFSPLHGLSGFYLSLILARTAGRRPKASERGCSSRPAFSPLSREMQAKPIAHRVYLLIYLFIYLFIYLYASTAVLVRGIGILALVNSLQQKLILNYLNWKPTVVIVKSNLKRYCSFIFLKRNIIYFGKTEERKLVKKTVLLRILYY